MHDIENVKINGYWQLKLTDKFIINAEVIKKDSEGITILCDGKEGYLPHNKIKYNLNKFIMNIVMDRLGLFLISYKEFLNGKRI